MTSTITGYIMYYTITNRHEAQRALALRPRLRSRRPHGVGIALPVIIIPFDNTIIYGFGIAFYGVGIALPVIIIIV